MTAPTQALSRRRLFAGAAGAGAVAVASTALPLAPVAPPQAAQAAPKPERGGGFVPGARAERYYQSARV